MGVMRYYMCNILLKLHVNVIIKWGPFKDREVKAESGKEPLSLCRL